MGRATKAAFVWKRRIEEQRQSGLSIALFCQQQGFSAPSFYVWRKRLHGAHPAQERARAVTSASDRAGAAGHRHRASSLFVPVTVASADHRAPAEGWSGGACQGVRMELPGGVVVNLPGEASLELVAAAIRAAMPSTAAERPAC